LLFFDTHVLCLRSDKAPNLVALETAHLEVPHRAIVVRGAGAANLGKEFSHGVFSHSGHANRGANRAAFDQASNHSGLGLAVEPIHIDSYTIAALACQE
jgi:hypothetical protein